MFLSKAPEMLFTLNHFSFSFISLLFLGIADLDIQDVPEMSRSTSEPSLKCHTITVGYANVSVPHLLQPRVLFLSHLFEVRRNFILWIVQSCKCKRHNTFELAP